MSEPVMKQRSPVDLDAFERSVRQIMDPSRQLAQGHQEDPLAELARLVGTHHDPYGEVFAQDAGQPRQGGRPPIDFAAIEAGLRGPIPAYDPHPADHGHYGEPEQAYYDPRHDGGAHHENEAGWYDAVMPAARQPVQARSRRSLYTMAAVIAVGVVGIGVAFAYKGSNSGPREIAMIKAAPGPTKIQPPADETGRDTTQDAALLDNGQQPTPRKLVSREEQPVDLAQTVQNTPPSAGVTPIYSFGSASTDAASVPVPSPPGLTRGGQRSAIAGDIEPIRVKTRSYRPDGTPIPNDQPPAAALGASAPATASPSPKAEKVAVAKASTPKTVTPKSTTRATPPTKPIVTADRGDAAPTDLNPAATDETLSPSRAKPVKPAKPAKPVQTATAEADATPVPASTGGFAVQLAAPGSEAEAKQVSARLSQKYADELSGRRLSFHKAESNGKAIFRVRVSSLTREEATGICEKLKSNGGTCFVAKN